MNNFDAIKNMNEKQMEVFLAHVFATGLNLGLYAVRQEDCDFDGLTAGCYDYPWLMTEAEPGTEFVFDTDAIRLNAGISEEEWVAAAAELAAQESDQLQIECE